MAFEQLKMQIMILLDDMENQPEDSWEVHEMILEKLNEMRATGMPLPQDLVELEAKLAANISKLD
jgi:hypothetical protein